MQRLSMQLSRASNFDHKVMVQYMSPGGKLHPNNSGQHLLDCMYLYYSRHEPIHLTQQNNMQVYKKKILVVLCK